jgi:hypothetical protein
MASEPSLFASAIEDHLRLKRRNSVLEPEMPIEAYIPEDPFTHHALFKTEQDARLEEEETGEHPAITLEWPGVSADGELEEAWLDRQQAPGFDWGQ